MSSPRINANRLLVSTVILFFSSQIILSVAFVINASVGVQRKNASLTLRDYSFRTARSRLFNAEEDTKSNSPETSPEDDNEVKNSSLLRLAELSLEDYKWRSSLFKSTEADRKVEESLARMMGDEAAYVRPMDASEEKIGPLVSFLSLET